MRAVILTLCILSCQAARELFFDCAPIKLINGFYHPNWRLYKHGTKVSYACIEGMKPLMGTWWAMTTCQNGKWSPVPRCIDAILCLAPEVPNAKPVTELLKIYTNGSSVEFACDRGYEFDAGHVAECVDGQWKLPGCRRKPLTCDPPARVHRATIVQHHQDIFEDNDTIEYVCERGYELTGEKFSSCRQKRWTTAPTCSKRKNNPNSPSRTERLEEQGSLNCQRPTLKGGFFHPDMDVYRLGSNVSYSCHSGQKPLTGTWWGVMTCQKGMWSHTPQCIGASSCLRPHVPKANPIDPLEEIYPNGANVIYTCERGYSFGKTYYASCVDGQWVLPVCTREAGSCDAPARVDNALIKQHYQTLFEYGQKIEYGCEKGYHMVGEAVSACRESRWTSTPACPRVVNCPTPVIKDGFFSPTSDVYEHGSRVYYSCTRGLKPALHTWWGEIACYNGTWSPAPQCIDQIQSDPSPTRGPAVSGHWPTCDLPPRVYNAIIENPPKIQFDSGVRVKYVCARGYELVGEALISCTGSGWTSTPACEPENVCQPPTLEGGFYHPDLDTYSPGSKLFYSCNKGLKPVFKAWWGETTCESGTWSHTPQCIDATMCLAPSVPNAKLMNPLGIFYLNGSSVEFACDRGYEFNAGHVAACVNGQWKLPGCKRKSLTCDPPARVHSATIVQRYRDIYEEDDMIEYACERGYELAGERFSSCRQKQWTTAPTCVPKKDEPVPTGSPGSPGPLNCQRPALPGGFFYPDMDHYEPSSNVSYSCHSNQKPLIGTWWGVITCQNGVWSHAPVCVGAESCLTPPVNLGNSKPKYQLLAVYPPWAAVSYVCDRGYSFPYREHAECQRGQWKLPHYCTRRWFACDPPPRVDNAIVNQPYSSVFDEDDSVEYVCRKGYELVGEKFSTCSVRSWRHLPTCVAKEENPNPTESPFQPVRLCGRRPYIPNADVWEQPGGRELKVQCYEHYELEGEEKITCVDRKWSELPACTPECEMDTSLFFQYPLSKYIKKGVHMSISCRAAPRLYIDIRCVNGRTLYKGCGFKDW